MNALDWFGRRCLAWPTMLLGALLTICGGYLLRFAAWIMDIVLDENYDTYDDY